ncbi:multimeric flavodoxin WrbA [Hasllibacter halocynthiae]|uniref:Multimeric flavodoxin WrbA n=1 Tax=Hasllibacter halocynthiae TaxID=595589 RepID=A0A2T0X8J4_9RHOB|nr:flavodoxin family protein [Hasllibacter halocynthiae]PRY95253.1 multimeric flavodoxin WrbA [Hasllibacter halocynthiae]
MPKIVILHHSGYGHTAKVAEAVADGAREGAEVTVLTVEEIGEPGEAWAPLHEADAIIFGSPTYIGSVSAPFEAFVDAASPIWAEQKWKDKLAAGFTCSACLGGDKQSTLQRMQVLAMQHGMVWVGLGLLPGRPEHPCDDAGNLNRLGFFAGAAAQAGQEAPPEEEPMAADLATARHLGKRVAEWAARVAR